MTLSSEYFKANVDYMFIAYSFVHIQDAIDALKTASEKVEAVIVQPYRSDQSFVSTEQAVHLYRKFKEGQDIPILFTSQGRMSEEGQFFEYGARLLDVLDREDIAKVERNLKDGRWVFTAIDDKLYARNFLIVKRPIVRLPQRLPISVATNVLRGATQGQPVQAVAIPAPKRIEAEYRNMLEIETFA